jgi:hypothetical protein
MVVDSVFNLASTVINKIWPDPATKAEAILKLQELEQRGELAELASATQLATGQLEINKIEAASSNLFVSGWRPAVGWVCCFSFAYILILQPFLLFLCALFNKVIPTLPNIDTDLLGWALGGILGLGGMRTVEKVKGVSKNTLNQ